jgi:hypothetical protein
MIQLVRLKHAIGLSAHQPCKGGSAHYSQFASSLKARRKITPSWTAIGSRDPKDGYGPDFYFGEASVTYFMRSA